MKIYRILALCIMISALFSSCTETNVVPDEAELVSESEIMSTPGFEEWYKTDLDAYVPDADIVNEIKTAFVEADHKLVFFASSCGYCVGDQSDFARMMKVIHEAGIPVSHYQLYSIKKATYKHPYESRFNLNFLPSCFIMKNEEAVYSVADTMIFEKHNNPDSVPTYEELILDGLRK